jgi:hypothetical protein
MLREERPAQSLKVCVQALCVSRPLRPRLTHIPVRRLYLCAKLIDRGLKVLRLLLRRRRLRGRLGETARVCAIGRLFLRLRMQ